MTHVTYIFYMCDKILLLPLSLKPLKNVCIILIIILHNFLVCTAHFLSTDVQIGFEETDYSVNEEDGSVTLFVRVLSGELSSDVEIGFTTRDGTATSTGTQ